MFRFTFHSCNVIDDVVSKIWNRNWSVFADYPASPAWFFVSWNLMTWGFVPVWDWDITFKWVKGENNFHHWFFWLLSRVEVEEYFRDSFSPKIWQLFPKNIKIWENLLKNLLLAQFLKIILWLSHYFTKRLIKNTSICKMTDEEPVIL